MSIFGSKNKKEKVEKKTEETKVVKKSLADDKIKIHSVQINSAKIISSPRITEKAAFLAEKGNVYTFNVFANATKRQIMQAVSEIYKVNPIKVSILKVPRKKVFARGKSGVKNGGHKAYVCLKKGEKIDLM